ALNLAGVAHADRAQLHAERRRHGLDRAQLGGPMVRSRRTATRVTRGAISLSSSTHFALKPYSHGVKPVVFPPGRARLATTPMPTGSPTCANTMGTVRVACCSA